MVLGWTESPECRDKGVVWSDERIGVGVFRWFGHVMERDGIAKRIYGGVCAAGSGSIGRPRKRWINKI